MQRKLKMFLFVFSLVALFGCEEYLIDENTSNFEAYYYPPDVKEPMFLGKVQGIKNCRLMASSQANALGRKRYKGDYICCLITEKSTCARRMQ